MIIKQNNLMNRLMKKIKKFRIFYRFNLLKTNKLMKKIMKLKNWNKIFNKVNNKVFKDCKI